MARKPELILQGFKECESKLKRLKDVKRLKKIFRKGINAAAAVVVKSVRKAWPRDTGLSAKSVTKKIVKTRSGYMAVIGIDKSAVGVSRGRKHVPKNIDHLIELGFQTVDGKTVPAQAPLRRGYEAAKDVAGVRLIEKTRDELEKEVVKQ